MSRSIDKEKHHQEEWLKNRFKNFSKEELDKIAAQDKERKEAQSEIDRIVASAVAKGQAYDEDKIKELEEQKKKREEERWREFHWMDGKRK